MNAQNISLGKTGELIITQKFVLKKFKITTTLLSVINNTATFQTKSEKAAKNEFNEILIIDYLLQKSPDILPPNTKIFVTDNGPSVNDLTKIMDAAYDTNDVLSVAMKSFSIADLNYFLNDPNKNKWGAIYILSDRVWGNMTNLLSVNYDSMSASNKRPYLKDVIIKIMEKVSKLNNLGIYHGDLKLDNILIAYPGVDTTATFENAKYSTANFNGEVYLTDFEWSVSNYEIRNYNVIPIEFVSNDENDDTIRPVVPMLKFSDQKYNLGNWYKGFNRKALDTIGYKKSRFIALDVFYFAVFILYTTDKTIVIEDPLIQLALHFVISRFRMLSINEAYDESRKGTIDYSVISAEGFANYISDNIP